MMNRRTFIQGSSLVALTPALVTLVPLSLDAQPDVSSSMTQPPVAAGGEDLNPVTFKIAGWDHDDRSAAVGNVVSISVNRSWRTAWR